jgi:hypothetical protein
VERVQVEEVLGRAWFEMMIEGAEAARSKVLDKEMLPLTFYVVVASR